MTEKREPGDIELMRLLSSGDDSAFLEFYRRHQAGLYRFALHMSGRPESAADVVQETFLTLIRHSGKFNPEKGAPAAFLYGIARNHLRKLFDKEARYVPLPDDLDNSHAPARIEMQLRANGNGQSAWNTNGTSGTTGAILYDLEHAQTADLVRNAVLTLPDHYREPVTLCDLEGKSYSEAAALLECPVGTVRSRLNRARSILLEKLRPARTSVKASGARLEGKG